MPSPPPSPSSAEPPHDYDKDERLHDLSIPYECTGKEYDELQSLALEAEPFELSECARYGEVDAVRALLLVQASASEATASTSMSTNEVTTPLHMACANGHPAVVSLLLRDRVHRDRAHTANENGNTPLHWAAANGRTECVRLLLQNVTDIDVLRKNAFGRSALTEAFAGQHTDTIALLLGHSSASEERLLGGGKEVEDDSKETRPTKEGENDASNKTEKEEEKDHPNPQHPGVTHELALGPLADGGVEEDNGKVLPYLLVRELPIERPDRPFGDDDGGPNKDTTGLSVWCASVVMAQWIAHDLSRRWNRDQRILELGAGCGVPSLAAALYSTAGTVVATDINPATVENCRHNQDINRQRIAKRRQHQQPQEEVGSDTTPSEVGLSAMEMDWTDPTTWPNENSPSFDVVLGSDLVYSSSVVPCLLKVLKGTLAVGGSFCYVAPVQAVEANDEEVCASAPRDGLQGFLDALTEDPSFVEATSPTLSSRVAPPEYRRNPLANEDEDACFLHFNELAGTDYLLYEFRRTS